MKTEFQKLELYIVRCSDPHLWYADKVGERVSYSGRGVTYYKSEPNFYWSADAGGHKNIVLVCDAICLPVGADAGEYLSDQAKNM